MTRKAKKLIGWEEWCSMPALGLPAVKAKVDTGAKTSALHAYGIKKFTEDGVDYVRFKIHPLQSSDSLEVECVAPLVDHRSVTSSNGEREKRYVIQTELVMGEDRFTAELTLTSRHKMRFRMLFGREAIVQAKYAVDPARSFLLGKVSNPRELYS